MGYYSQFPGVIPHSRADYPRVTEQCAEGLPLSTRMAKANSNSGARRQDQPDYFSHSLLRPWTRPLGLVQGGSYSHRLSLGPCWAPGARRLSVLSVSIESSPRVSAGGFSALHAPSGHL